MRVENLSSERLSDGLAYLKKIPAPHPHTRRDDEGGGRREDSSMSSPKRGGSAGRDLFGERISDGSRTWRRSRPPAPPAPHPRRAGAGSQSAGMTREVLWDGEGRAGEMTLRCHPRREGVLRVGIFLANGSPTDHALGGDPGPPPPRLHIPVAPGQALSPPG